MYLAAMNKPIGQEALIPNPALKPLEPLVGTWKTEGAHPFMPGVALHGQTRFEWAEGGAFLVMRSEIDEPRIPSGVAVFGSDGDDTEGRYSMLYFDERGVSRRYDASMAGHAFIWRRDSASLSQRFTVTLSVDGQSMRGKGEMRKAGGAWEDDLALNYTRAE